MSMKLVLGVTVPLIAIVALAICAWVRRLTADPCPDCRQMEHGRRGRLFYRGDVDINGVRHSRFCCNVCPREELFSQSGMTVRHAPPKPPRDDGGSFGTSYVVMWFLCLGFAAIYAATVAIKDGLRYLWYLGLGILVFALVFVALVLWVGWTKAARLLFGPCPDQLCDGHLRFRRRLISDDRQSVIDQHECSAGCGEIVERKTPMWLIEQEAITGRTLPGSSWP